MHWHLLLSTLFYLFSMWSLSLASRLSRQSSTDLHRPGSGTTFPARERMILFITINFNTLLIVWVPDKGVVLVEFVSRLLIWRCRSHQVQTAGLPNKSIYCLFFWIFAMAGTFAEGSNINRIRRTSRLPQFVEHVRTSAACLITSLWFNNIHYGRAISSQVNVLKCLLVRQFTNLTGNDQINIQLFLYECQINRKRYVYDNWPAGLCWMCVTC